MKRIFYGLCATWLTLTSCSASFKSLQGGKGSSEDSEPATPNRDDADGNPENLPQVSKDEEQASVTMPDAPTLEIQVGVPPEDEAAKECDGLMVAIQQGKDLNFDGVLQYSEVESKRFVCEVDEEPVGYPGGDPNQNPGEGDCPAQTDGSFCMPPSQDPAQS